jgi:hypothetical protein
VLKRPVPASNPAGRAQATIKGPKWLKPLEARLRQLRIPQNGAPITQEPSAIPAKPHTRPISPATPLSRQTFVVVLRAPRKAAETPPGKLSRSAFLLHAPLSVVKTNPARHGAPPQSRMTKCRCSLDATLWRARRLHPPVSINAPQVGIRRATWLAGAYPR